MGGEFLNSVWNGNHITRDTAQQDALSGATAVCCGLKDSAVVIHGSSGCGWKARWNRQDQGLKIYTPVIATSLLEKDVVFGGKDKLRHNLEFVIKQWRPQQIFLLIGDSGSLINDPVEQIVDDIQERHGVSIIYMDVPGFKGLEASGTDIALTAIVNHFVHDWDQPKITNSVNLIAPTLMGSTNWVYDLDEIRSLLERVGINVNTVLTCNTTVAEVGNFPRAECNLYLTGEELVDLALLEEEHGIRRIGANLPLPLGVNNTEEWLLGVAGEFGLEAAVRKVLKQDEQYLEPLKFSYNTTWLMNWLANKSVAIVGPATWAASFAKFLYHDVTSFPEVIALYSETPEAIERAHAMLKDITDFHNPIILDNPLYIQIADALAVRPVEYAIGQTQDKSLLEGLGIPHLTMAGLMTVLGSFNFVPYPFTGYKGVSYILTMLGKVLENAFHEKQSWQDLRYQRRTEQSEQ